MALNFNYLLELWLGVFLIQLFHYREWPEIARLGEIIKQKQTKILKEILNLENEDQIFHPQINQEIEGLYKGNKYIKFPSKKLRRNLQHCIVCICAGSYIDKL